MLYTYADVADVTPQWESHPASLRHPGRPLRHRDRPRPRARDQPALGDGVQRPPQPGVRAEDRAGVPAPPTPTPTHGDLRSAGRHRREVGVMSAMVPPAAAPGGGWTSAGSGRAARLSGAAWLLGGFCVTLPFTVQLFRSRRRVVAPRPGPADPEPRHPRHRALQLRGHPAPLGRAAVALRGDPRLPGAPRWRRPRLPGTGPGRQPRPARRRPRRAPLGADLARLGRGRHAPRRPDGRDGARRPCRDRERPRGGVDPAHRGPLAGRRPLGGLAAPTDVPALGQPPGRLHRRARAARLHSRDPPAGAERDGPGLGHNLAGGDLRRRRRGRGAARPGRRRGGPGRALGGFRPVPVDRASAADPWSSPP